MSQSQTGVVRVLPLSALKIASRSHGSANSGPASAAKCRRKKQGQECRFRHKVTYRLARFDRHDLSEIARQQIEVDGVHKAIVIEISLRPGFSRAGEAGGEIVKVDGVHGAIEIGVAIKGV